MFSYIDFVEMAPTNDFGASFDVSDFISQKSFDVSSVWSTHTQHSLVFMWKVLNQMKGLFIQR